ncbi:futalosine hydrolase [Desulfopila aestuarii]|uniref:Futalosine hydrolase n=1 Tax=Desulfopila aestuarii DSM 18488 TaxID=1121416 RepID=A0A1M7XZI9_9BACT|nr:futalosine hydrolase [Desulfopila aestuarii]SHO44562.1 futalosine hydrolase [Desulfopila aestuarii DSM 18488]
MIVAVAATQLEIDPFLTAAGREGELWPVAVTGVGPVETAVSLGSLLAEKREQLTGVLQFGIGGAYIRDSAVAQVGLLEVCLATSEVLGDLGICYPDYMEYFPPELGGAEPFCLISPLLERAKAVLGNAGITCHCGNFVTVNGVSATAARGRMLHERWQGICENMEGAAAARLCRLYNIPLVEVRIISNMVEDRDRKNWQLHQACVKAGEIGALLMRELS